jgi:SAM-dependent methyltransferase
MDWERLYARQEYMTPAAAETVDMVSKACKPGADSRILDVASGKGEAACVLSERHGCRVLCVDVYWPFLRHAASKVRERGLRGHIGLVCADGGCLPVPSATFDVACCIGGPSIPGIESCLGELSRAVRPGGWVVVSDIAWRAKPEGPLGPEWGSLDEIEERLSEDEFAAAMRASGLEVTTTAVHGLASWEEYFRPMLEVIEQTRQGSPGDADALAWADDMEKQIQAERRAAEQFLDYATFVARKV